jgi:hypothetical protein
VCNLTSTVTRRCEIVRSTCEVPWGHCPCNWHSLSSPICAHTLLAHLLLARVTKSAPPRIHITAHECTNGGICMVAAVWCISLRYEPAWRPTESPGLGASRLHAFRPHTSCESAKTWPTATRPPHGGSGYGRRGVENPSREWLSSVLWGFSTTRNTLGSRARRHFAKGERRAAEDENKAVPLQSASFQTHPGARTDVAASDSQPCTAREGQDDSGSRQEDRELRMKVAIAFLCT